MVAAVSWLRPITISRAIVIPRPVVISRRIVISRPMEISGPIVISRSVVISRRIVILRPVVISGRRIIILCSHRHGRPKRECTNRAKHQDDSHHYSHDKKVSLVTRNRASVPQGWLKQVKAAPGVHPARREVLQPISQRPGMPSPPLPAVVV